MKVVAGGVLLIALALAGCGVVGPGGIAAAPPPATVSSGVLASYDTAVAAEIVYLRSGRATPAEATRLQALRVAAGKQVKAIVDAEAAGGNAAALLVGAEAAVSAYLNEAQGAK